MGGVRIPPPAGHLEYTWNRLCKSTVIDTTNVLEYYSSSPKKAWGWSELPCIAPPFQEMFLEAKITPAVKLNLTNPREDGHTLADSFGCLVLSNKKEEGWTSAATLIGAADKSEIISQVFLNIDADGRLSKEDSSHTMASAWGDFFRGLGLDGSAISRSLFMSFFLAVSFMHCKNVILNKTCIPEGLRKKHLRKTGTFVHDFHTLEIRPMRKVLDSNRTSGESLQHALHICRGHFKDYRQSGLFGKAKGVFWWDNHLRGNIEVGHISKDYKVMANA